jgi:hypothetical protein
MSLRITALLQVDTLLTPSRVAARCFGQAEHPALLRKKMSIFWLIVNHRSSQNIHPPFTSGGICFTNTGKSV